MVERVTLKDPGITLLRAIAMLMIVLCHLCSFWGVPTFLSQFFNVGVNIFLIISGWLYIEKDTPPHWIFDRWKKLCIPILLWVIIVDVISICFYKKNIGLRDFSLLFFNLQGLSWIHPIFPSLSGNGVVAGLEHLWFVSIIFCCYLLIAVKRIKSNSPTALIVFLVLALCLSEFQISLFCFVSFFIGCVLKRMKRDYNWKTILQSILLIIVAIVIRISGRHFYDDTTFYNITIAGFSHSLLATGLFVLIYGLTSLLSSIRRLAASWIVVQGDKLSYFIYITHYFFLCKQFKLATGIPQVVPQTLAFLGLTIASALALRWCSAHVTSMLNSLMLKEY